MKLDILRVVAINLDRLFVYVCSYVCTEEPMEEQPRQKKKVRTSKPAVSKYDEDRREKIIPERGERRERVQKESRE